MAACQDEQFNSIVTWEEALEFEKILLIFKEQLNIVIQRQPPVEACNFIKKETLAQVFSCEFGKIFKKTFFNRTPPVDASDNQEKKANKKQKRCL